MSDTEEKRVLKAVLKACKSDYVRSNWLKWLPWLGWLALASYLYLLLRFHEWLGPFRLIVLSLLAGAAYTAADIWTRNRPKWKHIVPHLDQASIEHRLREIDPN